MKLKKTVLAALLAALTCVATFIIRIPSPLNGYINLGDCVVLLCGWLLGPFYGFLAAGIGSGIADLSAGYIIYAPVTFLIKGIMAVAAYYIFNLFSKSKSLIGLILSGIVAEIIMIGGYYIFEGFMYGFAGSLVNIPANAVQGIAGIACAVPLFGIIKKYISEIFT